MSDLYGLEADAISETNDMWHNENLMMARCENPHATTGAACTCGYHVYDYRTPGSAPPSANQQVQMTLTPDLTVQFQGTAVLSTPRARQVILELRIALQEAARKMLIDPTEENTRKHHELTRTYVDYRKKFHEATGRWVA